MSGRGGYGDSGRRGRGGRFGGGRRGRGGPGGRGRAPRPAAEGASDKPREKVKPTFVKLDKAPRTNRSVFILAKVEDVKTGIQREQVGKSGRKVTITSTEALVGDETGSIKLYTSDEKVTQFLKSNEGKVVALMNIKFVIYEGNASLEAGPFSTCKTVEQLKEDKLIADDHVTSFEINKSVDRTKKPLRKPRLDDIADLTPERKGVHIVGKVGTVTSSTNDKGQITTEAVVGNSAVVINVVARTDKVDALKEGNVVVILNAKVTMVNEAKDSKIARMKLTVDRWGTIKSAEELGENFFEGYKVEIPKKDTTLGTKNLTDKQWELKDN